MTRRKFFKSVVSGLMIGVLGAVGISTCAPEPEPYEPEEFPEPVYEVKLDHNGHRYQYRTAAYELLEKHIKITRNENTIYRTYYADRVVRLSDGAVIKSRQKNETGKFEKIA